uniref:UDP-glucose 4-epimerase n=1 Tax=Panagrolaimus superbus TaxID=310955 RepID=A0A914YJ07_9BILA
MHILVTGGTGYTGSHSVLELLQSNHTVTVIGNLANSNSDYKGQPISLKRIELMTGKKISFKKVDLLKILELEEVFKAEKFDAVMHFASLKGIGESCREPLKFYYSNIVEHSLKEESAIGTAITNPYGESKYMIEKVLRDLAESDKEWNIICLRYSCIIGAHPSGIIGEDTKGIPNNLIPYICNVINGKLPFLTIFGDTFNTPDGTCVRDYIHVVDAARGNLAALNRIIKEKNIDFEVYNIGMGKGHSVLEIIKAMENAAGQKIPTKIMPKRPGDVACFSCDPTKAEKFLQWKAHFTVDEMCRDVWKWQKKNPNGYTDNQNHDSLKMDNRV